MALLAFGGGGGGGLGCLYRAQAKQDSEPASRGRHEKKGQRGQPGRYVRGSAPRQVRQLLLYPLGGGGGSGGQVVCV